MPQSLSPHTQPGLLVGQPGTPPGPFLRALRGLDLGLMAAQRAALIALLSGMALVVFANVVLRYVNGGAVVWAEEVARYAMVWLTLLGAGPVLRTGGHIAIENLQDALPGWAAQVLRALIALALCALGVGMVVMGWQYMQRAQFQLTPATQISFAYVYAAMPVGGALLLWSMVASAGAYVSERRFMADGSQPAHAPGVQL
jgi:TRAP-type transport system small permease protein